MKKNVLVEPVQRKNTINPGSYSNTPFLAYCVCGRNLMKTTPKDVWNGVQPICSKVCKPNPDGNVAQRTRKAKKNGKS